jgi:hypothetical protein
VRDRLDVGLVEGDEVIGEEVECPACSSFRRITAGECDEVGFSTAVEFALVDTVGFAAMNRREAVLGVAFAVTSDCPRVAPDGLTDLLVSQAVICV